MLTYTLGGRNVHITGDGQVTRCGKICADWSVEREPTNWMDVKTDCPKCGSPIDFSEQRRLLVVQLAERVELKKKEDQLRKEKARRRSAAMAMLGERIVAVMRSNDIHFNIKALPGAYIGEAVLELDGFNFEVSLKVKW